MDPLMSEDQELERLKEWWKRNGVAAVSGVVIGAALVFGNNWWRGHVKQQAETASGMYEQMMILNAEGKSQEAAQLGGKLMTDYDSTPYAAQAALYMARMSYESGDSDSALRQLRWAAEHADDSGVQHAARLRLARVLEDRGELQQALDELDIKDRGAYAAQYDELEGDLLAALGRNGEAREHYDKALAALAPDLADARRIIGMKRDDLGAQ